MRFNKIFHHQQIVQEKEGECLEFKDFHYPFNQPQLQIIQKTICSMVNHKGGRIFIGVTDERIVKGLTLTLDNQDKFVNTVFHSLIERFEPSLTSPEKLYDVSFIPVKDKEKNEFIKDRYVIKIIVKQGLTSKLYSIDSQSFVSYKRIDARVLRLNTKEIFEEIILRGKNPLPRLAAELFIDPLPRKIVQVQKKEKAENQPIQKQNEKAPKKKNRRRNRGRKQKSQAPVGETKGLVKV